MRIKIILFLFCFISNLYCMDLPEKFQQRSQQKGRPHKKIKKKKFYYSVNCPKQECTKEFERTRMAALVRPLVRHFYSQKHKHKLYDEFYKHVTKNAYKTGRKWSIRYSKKRFNAPIISTLVSVVMAHEFATEKNNPDVFEKMKKYVNNNVKTIYKN